MNIGEIIQNIATGGAVLLGITYVVGGLIVNLNLTRRGVVEYQILKVKFLVVGIIFLLHFSAVMIFAFVPVVMLAALAIDPAVNVLFIRTLSLPSILGALGLLYIWSRYPPDTRASVGRWPFWFLLSSLATVFPLYVLFHQGFVPSRSLDWVTNTVLAAISGLLTLMAAIYHYSAFYYGRPAGFGARDPIGMGIPTRVDIVCDPSVSADLVQLGLPLQKNILRDLYLIDETNDQYILSQERVPGGDGNNHTYKINKSLVKAILHKPDHMRKLTETKPKKK